MDDFRPTEWSDYVGQTKLKEELQVRITAARRSNRPLEHVLLTGPPGSGKTTLGQIIANRMGDAFTSLIMPVRAKALAETIRHHRGVLLLDEIHRAKPAQQEDLLPLLEDGYIQTTSGTKIEAGWLTVVGATTEPDKIIRPLWDRFYRPTIDPYTDEDMAAIVMGMAGRVRVRISETDALVYGAAATGVPRKAKHIVTMVRDLGITNGRPATPAETLAMLRIGSDGLTADHVKYLRVLVKLGGSRGVNTIRSMMELPTSVVTELEKLLIDRGYINYSTSGRELTTAGYTRAEATT